MTQVSKLPPIRQTVSQLLGHSIGNGQWQQIFKELDREGRIDHKTLMLIVVALCMKIEDYERYE